MVVTSYLLGARTVEWAMEPELGKVGPESGEISWEEVDE